MKNKFIQSTIILIIGGFISKILGMFIKIVLTRTITTKGIGIYSLVLPTFNLFITLCSLGLPVAISKLISEEERNHKKIVLTSVPFILLFNFLLMISLFFIAPFLSKNLLHNKMTYYPLMAIGLTLPFICISSIMKGYFFGLEKMFPTTIANIIEQIVRLILTLTVVKYLMRYSLERAIIGVVLINILSEGASIFVLLAFIPSGKKISLHDFKQDKMILKDLLDISIPTTGSRLIGSLSYFLEPIILTFTLTKIGYTTDYITVEYGIINGYVYSLLLLPSFFTMAISNALLPVVSHSYSNRNYAYTKYKIKQAIGISLLIGIPCTIILMRFPEYLLKFIYNTKEGLIYIKVIAPIFLLHYIQGPLTASMQAMGKAKEAMMGTLYGSILRLFLLFCLSLLHIGMWGLLTATLVNITFITIHHFYYVYQNLNEKKNY